jgi:hypothetical protein
MSRFARNNSFQACLVENYEAERHLVNTQSNLSFMEGMMEYQRLRKCQLHTLIETFHYLSSKENETHADILPGIKCFCFAWKKYFM